MLRLGIVRTGSSSALGLQFILMIIRKTAPDVLFAASGTLQSTGALLLTFPGMYHQKPLGRDGHP